jgi:deazaflavin-dependent oxidoreductase (nitroreductase family)
MSSFFGSVVMACSRLANSRGLYMGRRATRPHVALYRLSRGRLANHVPGLPAARILLLDHSGAKTGVTRTSPVMYYRDGNLVAVAASQAGQPTNPSWFHNLKANPETTIQIGAEKRAVRARVATGEERDRLWPEFVAFCPDYEFWQRLANPRRIPIVILESRNPQDR